MSLQIDVLHSFQTPDLAQAETENIATPIVLDIPIEMPFQKHLEMARKSQTKIAEKSLGQILIYKGHLYSSR